MLAGFQRDIALEVLKTGGGGYGVNQEDGDL